MIAYLTELYRGYCAWREERRKRKAEHEYARGYATGMKMLTSGEMTPEQLYAHIEVAQEMGHYHKWDHGARAAIYDFELSGVEKKDDALA